MVKKKTLMAGKPEKTGDQEGYSLSDTYYMNEAIKEARQAQEHDEVPIGAIVVGPDGMILGRGSNQVESQKTQRAHAESLALEMAAHGRGDWRLDGCTLYVTLEPCHMCMGLIQLSRVARVVYAASSPLFGYRLDKGTGPWVYKNDIEITQGVAADEAQQLLKQFFQAKRNKKG